MSEISFMYSVKTKLMSAPSFGVFVVGLCDLRRTVRTRVAPKFTSRIHC